MRNRILIVYLFGLSSSIWGQTVSWPSITKDSNPNTHLYSGEMWEVPQSAGSSGNSFNMQIFDAKEGQYIDRSILPKDEEQRTTAILQTVMAYSDKGEKVSLISKVSPEGKLKWMPTEGKWKIISVYMVKATLKEKAAAGKDGFIPDYFSSKAFDSQAFDKAFHDKPFPKVVLNDLYLSSQANWSPDFLSAFKHSKGYNFEDYLNIFAGFGNQDEVARIKSDYREVLADMLSKNFVNPWVSWVHSKKALTGIQALGSPGNVIDLFAASDIPFCQFSDTGSSLPNDTSFKEKSLIESIMYKFASSASHITGKQFVSSEITDSLLFQCKSKLDDLFVSGINYVRTPLKSNNSDTLNMYITRCQSFLQMGIPDNDFLLYFPVHDIWYNQNITVLPFSMDNADQWLTSSSFYKAAKLLLNKGYSFDYVTDFYISKATSSSGKVNVGGNRYSAIIVPMTRFMPYETFVSLIELAKGGATILFVEIPVEVPGLVDIHKKNEKFQELTRSLALMPHESKDKIAPYGKGKMAINGSLEKMLQYLNLPVEGFSSLKLKYISRKNEQGNHYFIANTQKHKVKGWINLAVDAKSVAIFDAANGNSGLALTRRQGGTFQVYLELNPGESLLLQTYSNSNAKSPRWKYSSI